MPRTFYAFLIFLFAVQFSYAADALPGKKCPELVKLIWKNGFRPIEKPPPPRAPQSLDPQAKWNLLGSGIMGGTVYRVTPNDGRASYVIKLYNSRKVLDNDLKVLEILKSAFVQANVSPPFGIIGHEKIEPRIVKLTDHKGTTVSAAYEQLNGPGRRQLAEDYNTRVGQALTLLEAWAAQESKQERKTEILPDLEPDEKKREDIKANRVLRSTSGTIVQTVGSEKTIRNFTFKPDNFVVDEEGAIYLIDPF